MPAAGADEATGPKLSLVVPAYRIADRIASNVATLAAFLEESVGDFEIVVVVDGDPATATALRTLPEHVRLIAYPENRGKGFAVRTGFLSSGGRFCGFIDADLELSPATIPEMLDALENGADIVVGSKRHPDSHVDYPPFRRVQSLVFQALVRLLFRLRVRDSQAGLKLMRREVAAALVDDGVVDGFAFDVELLAVARYRGFRHLVECRVEVAHRAGTTTRLSSVFSMLRDVLRIGARLRLTHGYKPPGRGRRRLETSLRSMGTDVSLVAGRRSGG